MPTAIEIIKQYLIDNGHEGLVNGFAECGCEIDDLQPCSESFADCKPGKKSYDDDGCWIMNESTGDKNAETTN